MENREQVTKLVKRIYRNRNASDLHSFTARGQDGKLNVEVVREGVINAVYTGDDNKTHIGIGADVESVVDFLVKYEIDLSTIEI